MNTESLFNRYFTTQQKDSARSKYFNNVNKMNFYWLHTCYEFQLQQKLLLEVYLVHVYKRKKRQNKCHRLICKIGINIYYYLKIASTEMTMVPISQPAFPNAFGIASAPVPTIKLNKNTRPTYI